MFTMRFVLRRLLPCALVLTPLGCAHTPSAPPPAVAMAPAALHSPWDTTPVTLTQRPYNCGPAPNIGPDIALGSVNRSQLSDEVKDATYAESTTALKDLGRRVVNAADTFRSTGSVAAAQCTVNLLASAAANGAMTGYIATYKGLFYQNEALRTFSISWLKVRGSNVASPQQTHAILDWMEGLVREERTYYEHAHCGVNICDLRSHRGIQTAVAAMAVGIAANDDGLVHWAVDRYHALIHQIDDRGMLHYDLKGEFALKENLDSAASLVQIAEFGEVNDIPLYAYDGGRIHLLVHTIALGIVDPGLYRAAVKRAQRIPKAIEPWEISWASVYDRRFPDPVVTGLLHQTGPGGADMWGGAPWDPDSNL